MKNYANFTIQICNIYTLNVSIFFFCHFETFLGLGPSGRPWPTRTCRHTVHQDLGGAFWEGLQVTTTRPFVLHFSHCVDETDITLCWIWSHCAESASVSDNFLDCSSEYPDSWVCSSLYAFFKKKEWKICWPTLKQWPGPAQNHLSHSPTYLAVPFIVVPASICSIVSTCKLL